jgi:3-phosphoshikimate 1-carboxyvinyltransferase
MAQPPAITIQPVSRPVHGSIRPPGSKSITNRALVCAALAEGTSTLTGALDSEDTRVMIECLLDLCIQIDKQEDGRRLAVHGCSGRLPAPNVGVLFVGNSGTTIRFLTAMCTLGKDGMYELKGVERMHQRPIGDLADALAQLGASVSTESPGRCPPVVIGTRGLRGGRAVVRGSISSQFLSALLMVAPHAESDVELAIDGKLVSRPYISMTLRIVEAFGGKIEAAPDLSGFQIRAPQKYLARTYAIEPDASAASYFWAAAAITGGDVMIQGLGKDSLQGDVKFVECLQRMGCRVNYASEGITVAGRAERGIDVDMNAISDTVQTLAAVALFVEGPTTIRGVAHIRHKETDRIGDLARELRKFGATVDELPDGLRITPPADIGQRRDITIETYNDHRMAMSLALPGLVLPGITILNPACTAKTYPRFFDDLKRLVDES